MHADLFQLAFAKCYDQIEADASYRVNAEVVTVR